MSKTWQLWCYLVPSGICSAAKHGLQNYIIFYVRGFNVNTKRGAGEGTCTLFCFHKPTRTVPSVIMNNLNHSMWLCCEIWAGTQQQQVQNLFYFKGKTAGHRITVAQSLQYCSRDFIPSSVSSLLVTCFSFVAGFACGILKISASVPIPEDYPWLYPVSLMCSVIY